MSVDEKKYRRYRKKRVDGINNSEGKSVHSDHLKISSVKSSKKYFMVLLFLSVSVGGIYFYKNLKSSKIKTSSDLDQEPMELVKEGVNKRAMDLKVEKAIQVQDVLQERNNEPVKDVDMARPDIPAVDLGVAFSNNSDMKNIVKEVEKQPFKNDMYEDPSNEIRRQVAHSDWLEQHLKEKNEREKKEFLENFIKTVEEQGYTVEITEDMQAIIHPAEEEKEDEEEFEDIEIDLK